MRLDEIDPAPYNPRTITPEALAGLGKSISRFGLVQPLVWNRRTRRLVGGHQRLAALRASGEKTAQVVEVDLPEIEEKALNVALNSPSIEGSFTAEVGSILAEIQEQAAGLFSDLRFDALSHSLDGILGFSVSSEGSLPDQIANMNRKRTMSFCLTESQAETVRSALDRAAEDADPSAQTGNESEDGNCLAIICASYVGR